MCIRDRDEIVIVSAEVLTDAAATLNVVEVVSIAMSPASNLILFAMSMFTRPSICAVITAVTPDETCA